MTKTVLLTGITGFIAKQIAFDLLNQGYKVLGSLRSKKRADEVRKALAGAPLENLSFVTLDLSFDDGWAEALSRVDILMHTASPFPMVTPENEKEIITPAVEGTVRALRAAQKAGVNRVVLTASMVTIMQVDRPAGHKFGPKDWTDVNHAGSTAYYKSKTLAEKAAWDFTRQHEEMELTTIHPGVVWGTPRDRHYGTSLGIVERIMGAKDPMQPNIGFPVCDIADVSKLHIEALERPETIGKRVVCSDRFMMMPEAAQIMATAHPDRNIKTKRAPRFLLKAMSWFDPAIKSILPQLDREIEIDNSETKELFEMEFIPSEDSIRASANFIAK